MEARKTKRISLKERLEQFYNQPIEVILSIKREPSEEVDWGKPVGKEFNSSEGVK